MKHIILVSVAESLDPVTIISILTSMIVIVVGYSGHLNDGAEPHMGTYSHFKYKHAEGTGRSWGTARTESVQNRGEMATISR